MKYFLLSFSLLFLMLSLNARPVLQGGTVKADSLLSLVSLEIKNVNPAQALELAIEAFSLSNNINYSKGIAMSCFYIGQMLSYLGDYQKSIEYLSRSEHEKYSKKSDVMKSEISRIKGQVYYMLNLQNASFNEFMNAYRCALRIKDKKDKIRYVSLAYENLGSAYNIMKEMPDSSFYWFKKNEKLLSNTNESQTYSNFINLYTYFGEHFAKREQFDSASFYFEKADKLIRKYEYPYSSWLYIRWGDLKKQQNNSDSALILYRKGLENVNKTGIKTELPAFYKKLSDIHSILDRKDSAKWYDGKALELRAELSTAQNDAVEKAFGMLLAQEHKMAKNKQHRIITLSAILFGIALFVTIILLNRSAAKGKMKESEVSELKQKLNNAFEEVIDLAKKNETSFLPRFREVYPEFSTNLLTHHRDLTNNEFRLCALIFLQFPSKEIAEYMFITHRSVQTNKNRLRKKLNISGNTDIYQHLKSFSS